MTEFIRKAYRTLFFLVSIVLSTTVLGQQYPFTNYNTPDGLIQSQVSDIKQDPQGRLWLATYGGISSFDGDEFVSYSADDGLVSEHVRGLYIDEDNTVYATGFGGFSYIQSTKVASVRLPSPYHKVQLTAIYKKGDVLFLGTKDSDLLTYSLKDKTVRRIFVSKKKVGIGVRSIVEYKDKLWVATQNKLICFNDDFESFKVVIDAIRISDFCASEKYGLAMSTYGNGVVVFSKNKINYYTKNDGLKSNFFKSVYWDRSGNIWVVGKSGANFFKPGVRKILSFDYLQGLEYYNFNEVLVDRQDNVWFGTDGKGVTRFYHPSFVTYNRKHGLSSEIVMSITPSKNRIWFSTYGEGLSYYKNGQFYSYELNELLPNQTVWNMLTDRNGEVWVATSRGLAIVRDREVIVIQDALVKNKKILNLYEDEDDLWIGLNDKLVRYNFTDTKYHEIKSYRNSYPENVRDIIRIKNRMYLACRNGIFLQKDDVIYAVDDLPNALKSSLFVLEYDAFRNTLWIGTNHGLYKVKNHQFQKLEEVVLSAQKGTKNTSFLKKDGDVLWVGTNGGVFKLDLYTNETTEYGLVEGLPSLECNLNAVNIIDNNIWIGTGNGLISNRPYAIDKDTNKIKSFISLNSIKLFLEDVDWSKTKAEFNAQGTPTDIVFSYRQNYVSFFYKGVDLSHADKIIYQYKLDGFDEDWLPKTNTNFATYSNLEPGDYIFRVKARGQNQIWSDELIVNMTINAPFWKSIWFRILVIVAFCFFFLFVSRIRIKRLQEKRKSEKLEYQSKLLSLEQQNLNASMNRHFIFNALNSIQYFINRNDRLQANKYLSRFAKLIRKNLDCASAKNNLTTLEEEIERIQLYVELEKMRFDNCFQFEVSIAEDVDVESVLIPAMLFQPFIENAIWHGLLPNEDDGLIKLNISYINETLCLKISDNGIGIDESTLRKEKSENLHKSQGMRITSDRIQILRKLADDNIRLIGPENIRDADGNNQGTRVVIYLPIVNESNRRVYEFEL